MTSRAAHDPIDLPDNLRQEFDTIIPAGSAFQRLIDLPDDLRQEFDQIIDRFEDVWQQSQRPDIADFLPNDDRLRLAVLRELVHVDVEYRCKCGEQPRIDEYFVRYSELKSTTGFAESLKAVVGRLTPNPEFSSPDQTVLSDQDRESDRKRPERIGRYRVERVLGQGGFGLVYLAFDEQLGRPVAVKVPHARLVSRPEDAEPYLAEARTIANLDHPNIVPVYDIGSTTDYLCFVVAKYIDGEDLATRIKRSRLTIAEAVQLVVTVAEALHYAHKRGLVHRDIKPGNILIDKNAAAFVVEFGLALREQDVGKGPRYAGTPAYMSPEQARGEGHRVDGRSDIFSLAVVLYELLVGRRPFTGETAIELLEAITKHETKPPRQIDDSIPKELERICLKALSKRASERYTTAKDMADDLRHFLTHNSDPITSIVSASITPVAQLPSTVKIAGTTATPLSDSKPIRIVPKGLRSFDAHDADFFLELLPGPRDREGLPDSLRFWKTRIEETDADNTFSVGLVYGPSGCGKSSLVKAGLLPRLSENVISVYVEATADETETRLLNGLRKRCPALPENLSLKETLAALRRGQRKVVIVLDQFEQWLHAKKDEENAELVEALRQCDGGRLQCIVMVRDDFWLSVSRFLRELEVRLVEGQNSALVDLFPIRHAEKVLAAFGRAFGVLPDISNDVGKDQQRFLEKAVADLAQEGKVISVRLALFAEMMKGKPWTPATLKEVGGTEGVGATFLEETFSAATAPPEHRYHQKAARAVLKSLLRESGSDIKGHMRSRGDLLEASGYVSPKEFDDLIRILDSEIRLITPTDPDGEGDADESSSQVLSTRKYYQLTHDYLVPSLRDWLTRKQRETRRGRAELLLEDRASVWKARPENRQLPSLLQWFQIRWRTRQMNWTPPQRKMMGQAARYHAARGAGMALLLAIAAFAELTIRQQYFEQQNAIQADNSVDSLLTADIAQVPAIVSDLKDYRKWVDPLLRTRLAEASHGSSAKLRLALALLPVDDNQIAYLGGQLPLCSPEQLPVVRKALWPYKAHLTDALWRVAQDKSQDAPRRFQAAAALAEFDPEDNRWQETAPFVTQHLTSVVSSVYLGQWPQLFQTASRALTSPLTGILADRTRSEQQREAAAFVLSDYLRDQPDKLVDVILVADELAEYSPLIEVLKPHAAAVKQSVLSEMHATMPVHLARNDDEPSEGDKQLRDAHWKRQSLAAVTLVHLGHGEEVWSLLKFSADPSLRSFIIYHLGKLRTDHRTLSARLDNESEVSIRRALIQSLGGLDSARIPPADRLHIIERLQSLHVHDQDPGIHSSASWTLRQWGVIPSELPVGEPDLRHANWNDVRRWYVNGQGQTMLVIPNPAEYRNSQNGRHSALSSHEVTVAEFRRFREQHRVDRNVAPTDDCPVGKVTWFDATEYCNWLSQQEGIPEDQWVFQPNDFGQYAVGMRIKETPSDLLGYRLPTDGEWESACRAGTSGSYGFGEPLTLLKHYGWYAANSSGRSHSVESLLPNDAGLFDSHGNLWEWTQDPHSGPLSPVNDGSVSTVCGGSFGNQPPTVCSAHWTNAKPMDSSYSIGFRLAKTLPLFHQTSLP